MSDCKVKYITIERGEGEEDLKLSMDEALKLYHELDKLFGLNYNKHPFYLPSTDHKGYMHTPVSPPLKWQPPQSPHCEGVKFKQPYGSE
jgi:hypothetical protein